MLTVYKVKGKKSDSEFLFKYDLNGDLILFEVIGQKLSNEQIFYFFKENNFPSREQFMIDYWLKLPKYKSHFEITKVPPDLSFDTLWEMYDYKVSKPDAIKAFKKLTEADIIKVFQSLKKYEDYLIRTKIGKLHLSTYLNKRRFEDEYK